MRAPVKQKHFINSHKAATGPVVLLMMAVHAQWHNPAAWTYLALHGTYGLLWLLKSAVFPDKSWEKPAACPYGLGIWSVLTLYWVAPWMLMARGVQAPAWYLGACVAMYAAGVFLHFAADMQKHVALRERPNRLITDGLFKRCRNTNYFGELLIYLAFALLAMHWIPLAILALMVAGVWIPNMLRKDRSLSRYPEFEEYRKRSKLFIPFVV